MKIHSPFKDYYDCMLKTNRSEFPIYIRSPREHPIQVSRFERFTFPNTSFAIKGVIYFCGKYYPFVDLDGVYFYSFPKLREVLKTRFPKKDFEKWNRNENLMEVSNKKQVEGFFMLLKFSWLSEDSLLPSFKQYMKPYVSDQDPIVIIDLNICNAKVKVNSSLKNYNFEQVFNPQEAFMILERFLCNLAIPLKPIPEIKDEHMAASKGFDKFSFRKDPTKKKHRK